MTDIDDAQPAPALLLGVVAAEPPAELVDRLRALLPDRPVEVIPAADIRSRATDLADRPVVVVPWLLSSADDGGQALREATQGLPHAITTTALGPHPVLSAEVSDAARRAGLRADAAIVVVAAPPAGTTLVPQGSRPDVGHVAPAQPDPDDLTAGEVAGRRDLAQVVYDIDSVWVGPVAGALAGAQPSPVDVVRYLAANGRDVAVVQYALTDLDLDLDSKRLALVGATVVVRPGIDEKRVGVVVDRYEQGVAELAAGLDEDAWTVPLV